MNTADKVVDVALGEVGYLEKSKSAYIANPDVIQYKIDGAGYDNITKYAAFIDKLDWYAVYVQYGAWCTTYTDYCFIRALGTEAAKRIKCHGQWDSLVDCAIDQYKAAGRWRTEPKRGDQIFFSKANGVDPAHTGIVVDADDTYVYTVEGNCSPDAGVTPNGGGVHRKQYRRDYYRIMGYGRPYYEEEDEEDMDISKLVSMLAEATPEEKREIGKALDGCVKSYRLSLTFPNTMQGELDEAIALGITDGSRPMDYSTRGEVAIMVKRDHDKK